MALELVLFDRESEGGLGQVMSSILQDQLTGDLHGLGHELDGHGLIPSDAQLTCVRARLVLLLPTQPGDTSDPCHPRHIAIQVMGVRGTVLAAGDPDDGVGEATDTLFRRVREPERLPFHSFRPPRTYAASDSDWRPAYSPVPWRDFLLDVLRPLLCRLGDRFLPLRLTAEYAMQVQEGGRTLIDSNWLSTTRYTHLGLMWRSEGVWVRYRVHLRGADIITPAALVEEPEDEDAMWDAALAAARQRLSQPLGGYE